MVGAFASYDRRMTIPEHDPDLYALATHCLRGDFVSLARDQPDTNMLEGMLRSLDTAQVGELHACGGNCRSFQTAVKRPDAGKLFTIRFHVHGELSITCDADGTIYRIERLLDQESKATTCYMLTARGWVSRPIVEGYGAASPVRRRH
jgi:hypothetical protein